MTTAPLPWQIAFWRHHPVADQDAGQLAAATLQFQRRFPMDVVKVTPGGTYHSVDHGLVDDWQGDALGRRTILHHPVTEPGDWDRIATATEIGPSALRVVEAAALTRAGLEPDVPLLVSVFSPLTQAAQLAGVDVLRRHLAEAPQAVTAALGRLSAATQRLIGEYRRVGLDGIYFATQHMAHPFFTPQDYARWARPFDQECLAAAAAMPANILHAHGSDIHLSLTLADNWALHFEMVPENPPPSPRGGRALLGVPAARLAEAGRTVAEARTLLDRLAPSAQGGVPVLSVGCVLPLAFPEAAIDHWLTAVRGARTA